MKTIDEIYKIVLDFSLKYKNIKNGKLIPKNFKVAWSLGIISEEEYDFYFKNEL